KQPSVARLRTGSALHHYHVRLSPDIHVEIWKVVGARLEHVNLPAKIREQQRGIAYVAPDVIDDVVAADQPDQGQHCDTFAISPVEPVTLVPEGVQPDAVSGPLVRDRHVAHTEARQSGDH